MLFVPRKPCSFLPTHSLRVLNNVDVNSHILARNSSMPNARHFQISSSSKAAASFARRAYWPYVSAHGPKRAKSVSPKVRKTKKTASGFFQQRLTESVSLGLPHQNSEKAPLKKSSRKRAHGYLHADGPLEAEFQCSEPQLLQKSSSH